MSRPVLWSANIGPNGPHWNHTVQIFEARHLALEYIAKRPEGWCYAVLRLAQVGPWQEGERRVTASDAVAFDYAKDFCTAVNNRLGVMS